MARKYRQIDPRVWDDEVFDSMSTEEALCALWVLTSGAVNRAGVLVATLGEAADKCRSDSADTLWHTLSSVCSKFSWPCQKVGRSTVVIVLINWFRYNQPTNQKHLQGMLSDLDDVPRCEVILNHYRRLRERLTDDFLEVFDAACDSLCQRVSDTLSHTLSDTLCHTLRAQEQEQEQEQEQKEKGIEDAAPSPRKNGSREAEYSQDFEILWQINPLKKGKGGAAKAFTVAVGKIASRDFLAGLSDRERRQRAREWLIERYRQFVLNEWPPERLREVDGKTPHPMPRLATWLADGRYDDDIECWRPPVAAGQVRSSDNPDRIPDAETTRREDEERAARLRREGIRR